MKAPALPLHLAFNIDITCGYMSRSTRDTWSDSHAAIQELHALAAPLMEFRTDRNWHRSPLLNCVRVMRKRDESQPGFAEQLSRS